MWYSPTAVSFESLRTGDVILKILSPSSLTPNHSIATFTLSLYPKS
jgi:hypothetical protein